MTKKFNLLFGIVLMSALCFSCAALYAQQAVLRHSYPFDDGTAADVVGHADGNIHGNAKVVNGQFLATEPGQFIALPAAQIRISKYSAITLEAFIGASPLNGSHTMLSYFGDTIGDLGTNYLFQAAVNGGFSKAGITCKNNERPWITETATRGAQLLDGQYHHLVTTFNNDELKLYVDGKLVGFASVHNFPDNVLTNVGSQFAYLCKGGYSSDETWRGTIDQFNIYDGILDEKTIALTAQEYLDRKKSESVSNLFTDVVVDATGKFAEPLTGKVILFAEMIPKETDGNNWVDELLTFSDGPVVHWGDFSAELRFGGQTGFVDVWDEDHQVYDPKSKVSVEIDHVYQCWVDLNVPANTYNVYVKTDGIKQPVLIWKDARFRKKVTSLTHWSVIHNKNTSSDVMLLNSLNPVDKVGTYPKGYKASVSKVAFSIDKDPVPAGALVIDNPKFAYKSGTMQLKKIVLTDQTTTLYFHTLVAPGSWISIPEKTFIRNAGSEVKLFITGTVGIPMSTRFFASSKGYVVYKLIFPAIDKTTTSFDYGEDNGGNWSMQGIELRTDPVLVAESNYGNWFNTTTGDWEISLFENTAIYKCKVWKLEGEFAKASRGTIRLSGHGEPLTLHYKRKGSQLLLGENPKALHALDKTSRYATVAKLADPGGFKSPVLKPDTATVSGYYYGYHAGLNNKTGTIYVGDAVAGGKNHMVEIQDNGYFSVKIPITHPQEVYSRMWRLKGLFLEPGEEIFILVNFELSNEPIIMGANAQLISELASPELNSFQLNNVYNEVLDVVLDMSAEKFKSYMLSKRDQDLKHLEDLHKTGKVSQRFYQVKKGELYFSSARDILHYHYTSESAYRRKHNIPETQRNLPVAFSLPDDPSFYDFIKSDELNNEQALLAGSYGNFLNALKYNNAIRTRLNAGFTGSNIMRSILEYGQISADERALLERFINLSTEEYETLEAAYMNDYNSRVQKLIRSNMEQLTKLENVANKNEVGIVGWLRVLAEVDTLSADDRAACRKGIEYYTNPVVLKVIDFGKVNGKAVNEIINANYDATQVSDARKRNAILTDEFGIEPGLSTDLMFSEDLIVQISELMTPLSADLWGKVKGSIKHVAIANYVEEVSKATRATIDANKNASNYVLNEVPVTEADKVFDAIVSKYKGKVVYVDFWATWCGPCRMSIQNQKAMKEELSGQDVTFVYITNMTSPEATYKNMIPTIKGEHYRVTDDEWNYLCKKFNISGIPHYAIVDRTGKVVDPNASREPEILKVKFKELLNQ